MFSGFGVTLLFSFWELPDQCCALYQSFVAPILMGVWSQQDDSLTSRLQTSVMGRDELPQFLFLASELTLLPCFMLMCVYGKGVVFSACEP